MIYPDAPLPPPPPEPSLYYFHMVATTTSAGPMSGNMDFESDELSMAMLEAAKKRYARCLIDRHPGLVVNPDHVVITMALKLDA